MPKKQKTLKKLWWSQTIIWIITIASCFCIFAYYVDVIFSSLIGWEKNLYLGISLFLAVAYALVIVIGAILFRIKSTKNKKVNEIRKYFFYKDHHLKHKLDKNYIAIFKNKLSNMSIILNVILILYGSCIVLTFSISDINLNDVIISTCLVFFLLWVPSWSNLYFLLTYQDMSF